MTTTSVTPRTSVAAVRSLLSVIATVILATIVHAWDFGPIAFVFGAVGIAVLAALIAYFRRTGNRVFLHAYGLLALWVIGGFGIVGGFWNHAVKLVVNYRNGETLPAGVEKFFMSPAVGDIMYEHVGIMMFVASMVAAWNAYRFARAVARR